MYTYISSTALARSYGSQWTTQDLSDVLVSDLFNTYVEIYLTLSSSMEPDHFYVKLNTLRPMFSSFNGTLAEWLVSIDNLTLPRVDQLPNSDIRYARYVNAIQAGYQIDLTKIGFNYPDNFPKQDLIDLKITRPSFGTDLRMIHEYCMVSVNGFYHMTDADNSAAYVQEGGITLHKGNQNHLGLWSFEGLGKLTKIPLTNDHIYAQDALTPLKDRLYLKIDQDLTNKSVFLVLGGYLVFPDQTSFWQSGEQTFTVSVGNLPLLERYYESVNFLDLSTLSLITNSTSPTMVNVDNFFSDLVLREYFTLPQSFLVVVDTPNLFMQKLALGRYTTAGAFVSYHDPMYPLMVNHGKMVEYWKCQEQGRWSVSVVDSFYRNFVFSYSGKNQLVNVTDQRIPSKPFYASQGDLVQVGSYKTA